MTYYEEVLNILSFSEASTFDEIMRHYPAHKQIYVIEALKKGMKLRTIFQHKVEGEKRLFAGHKYQKIAK